MQPIQLWNLNDKATSLPQPNYPEELLQNGEKKSVEVEVRIHLQKGNVVSAINASKNSVLGKYAVESAMLAKFRPIEIEGRPIYGKGTIIYNFPQSTDQKPKTEESNFRLPIIVVDKIVNNRAKFLPKPIVSLDCYCSGTIKVRIVVNINGDVINASTESGHPLLRSAALRSATNTKFTHTNDVGQIFVVAYLLYKFNSDGTIETDFSEDKEK